MDSLPDELVVKILTYLGWADEIVPCAVLSKRFNSLVSQVQELRFQPTKAMFLHSPTGEDYQAAVTKTVFKMHSLKRLDIIGGGRGFTEEAIRAWLSHTGATLEHICWNFQILPVCVDPEEDTYSSSEYAHPIKIVANCPNLKTCDLSDFNHFSTEMVEHLPSPIAIGPFKKLKELYCTWAVGDKDAEISRWLTLIPNLEKLRLDALRGPALYNIRLDGCLPRLRELSITDCEEDDLNWKDIYISLPTLEKLSLGHGGRLTIRNGRNLKQLKIDLGFYRELPIWDLSDEVQLHTLELNNLGPASIGAIDSCTRLFYKNCCSLQSLVWTDSSIGSPSFHPCLLSKPLREMRSFGMDFRILLCLGKGLLEAVEDPSRMFDAATESSDENGATPPPDDKSFQFVNLRSLSCYTYGIEDFYMSILSSLVQASPVLESLAIRVWRRSHHDVPEDVVREERYLVEEFRERHRGLQVSVENSVIQGQMIYSRVPSFEFDADHDWEVATKVLL